MALESRVPDSMHQRGTMKLFWKIVLLLCVALIFGAAVSWHFVRARAAGQKLVDDAKACRMRAEQGDANAQYELARLYYEGKGVPQDYREAFDWYRKAADRGNVKAQYGVGFMYDWGKGVPQDYTQAVSWCRKAAEQGYAKAQYVLGWNYYYGKGVPQDYSEAARWYRKAADQGYGVAQSELGYMYSQGEGVPQDYTEAVRWYRRAADQGYSRAQSALAYAYSLGKGGVPRDYTESARWYRKAAKQGDDYARRALDAMNIKLSPLNKAVMTFVFFGSVFLLIGSRGTMRNWQHRKFRLAGLFSILCVASDVYGNSHIGVLMSLSAVNVFFFGKSLVEGISVAILLSVVWQQGLKIAVGICGALFIAFNVYAAMHYDLRHFAACPRAFYSLNALLVGMAITLAIFLCTYAETRDRQNGNVEFPSETTATAPRQT